MVWLRLAKLTALGFGALVVLTVLLSVLVAVLGTLVGLGVAVVSLLFVGLLFAGTLAAGAAVLYRRSRPSASGLDPEGEGRTLR